MKKARERVGAAQAEQRDMDDEHLNWKDAIGYAAVSVLMLGWLIYSYAGYLDTKALEGWASTVSQRQTAKVLEAFRSWAGNDQNTFLSSALRLLKAAEDDLTSRTVDNEQRQRIVDHEALRRGTDNEELRRIVDNEERRRMVDNEERQRALANIREAKVQIEAARQFIRAFLPTIEPSPEVGGRSLSLGLITPAHAQADKRDRRDFLPDSVKIGFAICGFLVVVGIIGYCLWIIARQPPGGLTKAQRAQLSADKKWAKDLLNKQLVFIGGLAFGVSMK